MILGANVLLVASIIYILGILFIFISDFFVVPKISTKKMESIKAEAEKLRSELDSRVDEAQAKDLEIKRLNGQLTQMSEENKKQIQKAKEEKKSSLLNAKKEIEDTKAEAERLKSNLKLRNEEAQTKDSQINRLNEQLSRMSSEYKDFEERTAELKKIESDILWLKKSIDEQKKSSHQIKQRMEENKMKIQLLNEKTKENVELIASFAEGKEFDEFRKSIYLDETIQKYEDEIKALKIKNMDLENQLKGG